jgi:hypothetical protein
VIGRIQEPEVRIQESGLSIDARIGNLMSGWLGLEANAFVGAETWFNRASQVVVMVSGAGVSIGATNGDRIAS